MKRFLSVLLILCMVWGLVPATSAAATELTAVERAIVETLLAYYYKGPAVQYDSYYFGAGGRYGAALLRQTNDRSPESSSVDDIHYTVCSAYPWDAYMNATGKRIVGTQERMDIDGYTDHTFAANLQKMGYTEEQLAYEYSLQCIGRNYNFFGATYLGKDARSVGYWGPCAWDSSGNVTALSSIGVDAMEIEELMRPGDVITCRPYATSTVDGSTVYKANGGHTMVYLGNVFGDGVNYVIHSWGSKYDNNGDEGQSGPDGTTIRGFDLLENAYTWKGSGKYVGRNGSIVLTPYKDILGTGKSYDVAKSYDYSILRPAANMTEADLTDSALFRLDRPGITITKTADVKPYRDVVTGELVTYTVKIENNTLDTVNRDVIAEGYGAVLPQHRNRTYTDLVLTEQLSDGTQLQTATGDYAEKNGKVTWIIPDLAPGASVTCSYTVEVTQGTELVSPEGSLTAAGARGGLPTGQLRHEIVSQQLPEAKAAAITASSVTASSAAPRSGTDIAEDVYGAMGYELDLPHGQQLADMILQEVAFVAESAEQNKTDFQLVDEDAVTGQAKLLRQMVVPGFVGGQRLYTADENLVRTNRNRLRQFDEGFLQPGDVLVFLNGGRSSGTFIRSTDVEEESAYVYLGESRWAYYDSGVFTVADDPIRYYYGSVSSVTEMDDDSGGYVTNAKSGGKKFSYSEILHQSFLQDVFFLLRPSRAGLTETASAACARAVEVQSSSGSAFYADLASAVSAAAAGDTLVLHEDLTLSARQIMKAVTLDLNGHSITGPTTADTLLFNATGESTIKNGTVNGTVYASSSAVLHVEDMSLVGLDCEYGDTVVRYGPALFHTGNAKVTLERTSLVSHHQDHAPLQHRDDWSSYGNITVLDDVKVLIPASVTWDYSAMALADGVKAYTGQACSLDGKTKSDAYTCLTLTASPDVVNETTEEYYASLTAALLTAEDGQTLRLLRDIDTADCDETAQVYDGSTGAAKYYFTCCNTVELDMDGHTVRDMLSASGTFFIRDDGNADNGISTFTIGGGTIRCRGYGISGGQLVVRDMQIITDSTPVCLSTAGSAGQTALVQNSTLVGGFGGRGSGSALMVSRGSAVVRGSTLLSNSYEPVLAGTGSASYAGAVLLEDVRVYTGVYTYNCSGSTRVGSNAANSIAPAEGFSLVSAGQLTACAVDGKTMPFLLDTYDVTDPAAKIGAKNYISVERALEAAASGDTVTLLKNTATQSVTVPAGVTLDVDDFCLTLDVGAILTVAGKVTAKDGGVDAADGYVMPEGEGDYLGITVPAGVEGPVYAAPDLTAEVTFAVGSTLTITGTAPYGGVTVMDGEGNVLAEPTGSTFSLGKLAAKELGKEFEIVLADKNVDGTWVGAPVTVSLQVCAEAMLKELDWEKNAPAGKALVALLNYGAAAQTHFSHNTESLANANAGAYQSYLDTDLTAYRQDQGRLIGTKPQLYLGTSCVLGDDLTVKLYAAEGATFDVTFGGETVTGLTGSYTVEDILQYAPTEPITVKVYENGVAACVARDSLAAYLTRLYNSGETALADAILTYAAAVDALS